MTGMEQTVGTTGGYGGYSREWVDHRFGTALSYGYNSAAVQGDMGDCSFKSVTTASIERGSESVLGLYKQQPGHYTSYRYALDSHHRLISLHAIHSLDISVDWQQGYADEYRQQLQQQRDADRGYTSYWYETLLTFRKRYQAETAAATAHYRYTALAAGQPTIYGGLIADYSGASNKHLLPLSTLDYGRLGITAEAGTALFASRLWVDVETGRSLSTKSDLLLADAATDYAVGVLLPDMTYYSADYWHARLAVTLQLPRAWFVRVYGEHLGADHSLSRSSIGLTIGLSN